MVSLAANTTTVAGIEVLDWVPGELTAWRVPEVMSSAEWVQRHIKVPAKEAALPGPLNLDLTPYLAGRGGPFDALDDPLIETITLLAGSQTGKTTFMHAAMAAVTCQQPGPLLLVLPTEPDAREVAGTRLKETVKECEPLMAQCVDAEEGLTKEGYWFESANWYFGWSNSPASLGRRSCRYVFYDEADKFPPYVGREADPISLGDKRLRTFRNTTGAKSVRGSSPTTREGLISREWELSDQRRYWVPCPKCGEYQVLVWAQVTWPKLADGRSVSPDLIELEDLARYQCKHCGKSWTDEEKNQAVRRGVWARRGESVNRAGKVCGEAEVVGTHAGFHISALYSAFTRLSQLAAGWLRAVNSNDPAKLQDFINSELGEIWEETETVTQEQPLWEHRGTYKRGELPAGPVALTAFVDVQKDYFYVSVYGWAFGLESWLIDYKPLETETALHSYILGSRFRRAGKEAMGITLALIDSGSFTAMVYELCQRWRDIPVAPSKGSDTPGVPVRTTVINRNPRTGRRYRHSLMLYTFDANYWKDAVARRASQETAGPGYLHLPADLDETWVKQFASEHKIIDRQRRRSGRSSRRPRRIWVVKSSGRPNHYWDCAVGAAVAAEILNLRNLPDPNAAVAAGEGRRMGRIEHYDRGGRR